MKGHIGMATQPLLIFLVGRQIIQNHMNVLIGRIISHDLIHEFLKVFPLLGLGRLATNDAGGHFQCREEIHGPMTLVGAFQATNDLSARRS